MGDQDIVTPEVQPEVQPQVDTEPQHEKSVPYERFSEVNTKAKQYEDRVKELEAQLATSQTAPVADPFAPQQQQYQQPYQAPVQQVEVDPYDAKAKELGYQNWNQWAQYDMNNAMKGRQAVENTQRSMQELNQTQQRFAQEWFKERPDLIDINKRRTDAEFLEFSKIITENPYLKVSEKGLAQAKRLAILTVKENQKNTSDQQLREQAAMAEKARAEQAESATTVLGTGTARPIGTVQTNIKLSPEAEKQRARAGMTAEEFVNTQNMVNAQRGSADKKYVIKDYAKPQRPSLMQKV